MNLSVLFSKLMGSDTPLCIFCGQRHPKQRMALFSGDCGVCCYCSERYQKNAHLRFPDIPGVDFLIAPFSYTNAVQDAMIHYKFHNCRSYAPVFARCILDFLDKLEKTDPDFLEKYHTIIPVPLSRERFMERGYNQSALIAQLVAKERGLFFDTELLEKHFHNQRQSSLPELQRRANVLGVYRASAQVAGKHILLIDDIVTTGSTLSECARTLLDAGALSVVAIAVACTERNAKSVAFSELINP